MYILYAVAYTRGGVTPEADPIYLSNLELSKQQK